MKLLVYFFVLVPSASCVVVAAYLAAYGLDGWGWFLFVGLLFAPTISK